MDGQVVGTFVICDEIGRIAHELAAEHSKALIESMTLYADTEAGWLDLETLPPSCAKELQYAEARKLLRHHPTRPNLVQIIEE
jgi:hypothetical protein